MAQAGQYGKLIISEILCFIQNEILTTPKDVIVEKCVKFYSQEEVEFEKKGVKEKKEEEEAKCN